MNTYITPHEFAGMIICEEEHPLMERESSEGTRNITVFHTAGENDSIKPIRDSTDVIGDIYNFCTVECPESKNWNGAY